jgi:hypothetical protein
LRLLRRFLEQIGSKMDPEALKIDSKRFTLSQELGRRRFSRENLVYAGTYLGRNRRLFEPGSPLLQMLAAEEGSPGQRRRVALRVRQGHFRGECRTRRGCPRARRLLPGDVRWTMRGLWALRDLGGHPRHPEPLRSRRFPQERGLRLAHRTCFIEALDV